VKTSHPLFGVNTSGEVVPGDQVPLQQFITIFVANYSDNVTELSYILQTVIQTSNPMASAVQQQEIQRQDAIHASEQQIIVSAAESISSSTGM
jgi:hypothetical protein